MDGPDLINELSKRSEIESQERRALTSPEEAANYHLINHPEGTSQGTTAAEN